MSPPAPAHPLKLLVVQPAGSDAVEQVFRKAGHVARFGRPADGRGFEAALRDESWDAIVFDCDTPGCDARTALLHLRESGSHLPFIAVSASGDLEAAVELMRRGACDYLPKSKLDRLAAVILREISSAASAVKPADIRGSEESLTLLNAAIEAAPVGIIVTDTHGRLTLANSAALGRPSDPQRKVHAIPPDWRKVEWQFSHPDGTPFKKMERPLFRALREKKVVASKEMLVTQGEDRPRWVTADAAPIRDATGKIIGGVVVHSEISALKSVQNVLRHSEERLRQLVESSPFCIHEIGLDNRLRSINDAGLKMLRLPSAKPALGQDCLTFVSEPERAEIAAKLAEARQGNTVKFQLHLKSGQVFESTTSPIRNHAGQVTGLIGITQDITEQEHSRERLQLSQFMLEHITEAAFLVAEDGGIRDANPAAGRMLNYSHAELLHLAVWDISAVYTEKDWPQLCEAIDTRRSMTRETLYRRRDGTVFEVEVGSNLFTYHDHRYHVTIVRDISERKQAEIALRDSEERFRTLATNAPVGIFQTDREGRCIYVNSTWCRLAGRPPQDALGSGWMDAVHPDDRLRVSRRWSVCFERSEACKMDYRLRHRDGIVYWIASHAVPLPGSDGHRGYIGTITDITERQAAQRALEASEERYALVTRATNDAIWDINLLTGDVWWNESYDQLWGIRPPETNQSLDWWFDHIHPDDVERVQDSFNGAVHGTANVWRCGYRYHRTGGECADVLDQAYITRDAGGKATRILSAMADITELKHREQQLAGLARRMNAVREEERKRIAREIHDQLGQIMTVLKMNLIQLEEDILDLPRSDARNRLENDVVSATAMIDSSIESVRTIALRIRPSVLDQLGLGAALQQECEHFGQRHHIPCTFTADGALPAPTNVFTAEDAPLHLTDEVQTGLFRLTQEFLTNVARHAEADEVSVRLGQTTNFIRLEVRDNGVGFALEAARESGHLGLVGARERVENLGGILELITRPGHGTIAVVTIPVPRATLGKHEKNPDR